MKTLTYPNQFHSSFLHLGLTPLFRDRISYTCRTSLNSATMRENDECFVINVLVPGLNKKDLNIKIEGSTLTISSNLPVNHEDLLLSGLRDFSYSYLLPSNADADHITAKCKDGLLTVQVPKLMPKSTRTTIPVKGSENVTLKTSPFKPVWNRIKQNLNFSEWALFKNPVRALGSSAN